MARRLSKKETEIREKRTALAARNNLMGPAGKFGVILKAFGVPVLRQGSGLMDEHFLDDPYDDDNDAVYESTLSGQPGPLVWRDRIEDGDDASVYQEGLLFDGLSRGLHLEIVYWEGSNLLRVSYKGYTVYEEIAGELEAYAPFPEWESVIDRIHTKAKERVRTLRRSEEEAMRRWAESRRKSLWQRLRLRWGV